MAAVPKKANFSSAAAIRGVSSAFLAILDEIPTIAGAMLAES
jgi:hypothetical protein